MAEVKDTTDLETKVKTQIIFDAVKEKGEGSGGGSGGEKEDLRKKAAEEMKKKIQEYIPAVQTYLGKVLEAGAKIAVVLKENFQAVTLKSREMRNAKADGDAIKEMKKGLKAEKSAKIQEILSSYEQDIYDYKEATTKFMPKKGKRITVQK